MMVENCVRPEQPNLTLLFAALKPYPGLPGVPVKMPIVSSFASRMIISLSLPDVAGTKKIPKAYTVAVSPVRPNLAAIGTNTGMAFMTFDRMYPLPVAAVPLRNLAEAHVSPALRLPHEPVAVSYVAHMGDSVWMVSCTAVERVSSGK